MNIIEKSSSYQVTLDLESKLIDDRIVFIKEEITLESAIEIQSILLYLMSKSKEPISIYINSVGGSVYAGLSIYDTIKHLQNNNIEINTYAAGFCASMAAVLLISGTNRYSLPNSTIMFHSVSSNTNGKLNDMIVDVKETERLQNILNKIILKNCSEEVLNNSKYKDFYISPQDALKFKVIDKIL